jgi:hypothetical protein
MVEFATSVAGCLKHIFFFYRRCSPWWILASFTIALHWSRSFVFRLQCLTLIVFRSSSTESSHLIAGLLPVCGVIGGFEIYEKMKCADSIFQCFFPVPYSWVTSVKFLSAPLRNRDSTFQVPTRKSLFLLGRLKCSRPAAIIKRFSTKDFLRGGVVNPMPNPQPGGPGYPFLSESSPLTCPAWEALPVAMLRPRKPHHYAKVGITAGRLKHMQMLIFIFFSTKHIGAYMNE